MINLTSIKIAPDDILVALLAIEGMKMAYKVYDWANPHTVEESSSETSYKYKAVVDATTDHPANLLVELHNVEHFIG